MHRIWSHSDGIQNVPRTNSRVTSCCMAVVGCCDYLLKLTERTCRSEWTWIGFFKTSLAKEWRCRIQPRHEISKSAQHPLHDQCGSHWWYEDDSKVKRDGDCNVDDNDGRRWRRILVWLSCDRFLQLRLRSCKLEHVDWCRKLRLMDRCQCLPELAIPM